MKKFLSLALSLAMVFSMFTFLSVGANAADAKNYTDYSEIQYKEAVDVISALDIMGGYSGGSFGPTGGLTRGAATKIVCNLMVGSSTADKLPAPTTTAFFDVPGTHTFAATIAYCAENGFISGYSDGSFHPGDPLSGNAFLKMLLCALGYDQDVEKYRNTSAWATNVVARAVEVGLLDDMPEDFDGRTALTREQAALLAFNTLQGDMVEYDNRNTTLIVDGSAITPVTTGGTAKVRTWNTSNTNAANIDAATDSLGYNIVQFAELKFNRLVKDSQGDDFGRPSTKWTWRGDEIGEYPDALTKTYRGDKEIGDIYKDLGLTSDHDALFYVNGVAQTGKSAASVGKNVTIDGTVLPTITIRKNIGTKLKDYVVARTDEGDATKIGDGDLIEVFYDRDATTGTGITRSTTAITICATINYAGKISKVTKASGSDPRKVTVEFAYDPYKTPTHKSGATADGRDTFETESFAADDIVTFTYAKDKIQTVEKLTNRVEGGLTRYSRGNNLTVRGTQYGYANMIAFSDELLPTATGVLRPDQSGYVYTADTKMMTETLSTDDSYVVYTNDINQALWVEKADQTESDDGSSGYALVRWMDSEYYNGRDTNQARLVFPNGTQRTVDLYKDYLKDWYSVAYPAPSTTFYDQFSSGNFTTVDRPIVHYTRESDGTYRLTNHYSSADTKTYTMSTGVTIRNRAISGWMVTMPNGSVESMNDLVDSSTVFVINDDGTYRRYVGIRNAPNVSTGVDAYAYLDDGSVKYIWITDAVSVTTSSRDITFIAAASRSDEFEDGTGWDETYYTYNAVVAGEIRTIEVSKRSGLPGNPQLILNDTTLYASEKAGSQRNPTYLPVGNIDVDGDGKIDDCDGAEFSVILNNTTKNSSGRITDGYFYSGSVSVYKAHGVKTPVNGEIEVGTNSNDSKKTETFLPAVSMVNAYFVNDDGDITRLGSVYDIEADSDAWVFYTTNDDGDITNIFVCET